MRNPEAYQEHGRNNPRDPEQMQEHPYDFVSLPDRPKVVGAPGHDTWPAQLYSGILVLLYRTLTPLHVGSGVFESAKDCGLTGGDEPVRGIVRCEGRPVLPGSSWKGAVRARFEAVTRSRLALAKDFHRIPAKKTPEPLRSPQSRMSYGVKVQDPRLRQLQAKIVKHKPDPEDNRAQLRSLSPAESLFGAMGYRGRVHPGDGTITAGLTSGTPLRVAPMESPAAHRMAQPGAAENVGNVIEIRTVEGRKFYYDGDLVSGRPSRDAGVLTYEVVDSVPAGCEIRLEARLEAVTLAELGALLICSGYGDEAGVIRFGGFKPAGLGKVELREAEARLFQGMDTRSWRRPAPAALDLQEAVRAAHEKQLIDAGALAELKEVTTLRRP